MLPDASGINFFDVRGRSKRFDLPEAIDYFRQEVVEVTQKYAPQVPQAFVQ